MATSTLRWYLNVLLLGGVHALSFAPGPLPAVVLPYLQLLSLSVLAIYIARTTRARQAAGLGWLFGLGHFCTGLYWIFISLHTYGGLAAPLAVASVIALSAALALYYLLACWVARLCMPSSDTRSVPATLLAAASWASAWTLFEWLRGTAFTGFPWLNLGYAHIGGPFQGWAPLLGIYGLTWLTAWTSMAIALLWQSRRAASAGRFQPHEAAAAAGVAIAIVLALGGLMLSQLTWGRPHGNPLMIRLTQGNIPQSEKFDLDLLQQGLQTYMQLAAEPPKTDDSRPHAIILPETVMTLFQHSYEPQVWQMWQDIAVQQDALLIIGAPIHTLDDNDDSRYTNSVIGIDADTSIAHLYQGEPELRYDKHHLVPFGEFIPTGFRWFVDALTIPLGDFNRGHLRQTLFPVQQEHIALNICYEDVFGEEIIHSVRDHPEYGPGANLLLNVSNLGWFGDSWALRQHLQISRMRALETARPMLRATNTGITGVIDIDGSIRASLPAHVKGILDIEVQGMTGTTPYVRWGNQPVLGLSLFLIVLSLATGLRRRRLHTTPYQAPGKG